MALLRCLVIISSIIHLSLAARATTIIQKLQEDPDLSEFHDRLGRSETVGATIKSRSCTVFAPLNSAFQKRHAQSDEENNDDIVFYHISNQPQSLAQISQKKYIMSELSGNPPLWITKSRNGEIYVNNAKIIRSKSDFSFQPKEGSRQIQYLHTLDAVLEPLKPISESIGNIELSVNAYQFLNHSEFYSLDSHRLRSFRERVEAMKKRDVFEAPGEFTFFMPVDDGFQPPPRPDKIDAKVIDGHVIPSKVLFTSSTPDGVEYNTLAFTDMLKVSVAFNTDETGKKRYVKSHTVVGDKTHPDGYVIAEIVLANIPVQNGVVHLIHRPLVVVDNTVKQFLESFEGIDRQDSPLYKFYQAIVDAGGDFMDRLTKMKDMTLFAPSNAAWRDPNLNRFVQDRKKMGELLKMHLVEEVLTLSTIAYKNRQQVPTLAPRRNLYFNIINDGGNRTLTVEGGGVNATVVQPDIVATNGIIHIIDRVLGVPFTTVGEKIATDPMLNKTYILGRAENFNDQLLNSHKWYTYFVPRDYAWERLKIDYPSTYEKMFMSTYAYFARQVLERHLVVADHPYKMSELKNLSRNEPIRLNTVRDVVKLRFKEVDQTGYYVEWNNQWIHVFRPDVECTNGIIHVIDQVFVKDRDIHVTGSGDVVQPFRATLGFIICLIISQYF